MVTLNQILTKIKAFADNHAQIKSYGIGRMSEEDIEGLQYPVCWTILGDAAVDGKVLNVSFNILFLDRIKKDFSNENEVMSDMLSVSADFVATMRQVSQQDGDWNFITSSSLSPIGDATDDEASGWQLGFTVKVVHEFNYCNL